MAMAGAGGIADSTLQMMINVGQNLMGLDITVESLDNLARKARGVSAQVNSYFQGLATKSKMYFKTIIASMVTMENTLLRFANKAKYALFIVITTTGLLGKSFLTLGGEAEEMGDKFAVVFGKMTAEADQWARNYSKALGLSTLATKTSLGDLQNLFVGFGLSREGAFEFSKAVTTLTNDLASMNNIDPTRAMQLMTSSLMGEAQAAKSLGGALTEAQMKITSLEMGLGEYSNKMEEPIKMLIRYQTLLRQNTDALNNRETTRFSFTNQVRELKNTFTDLRAEIGTGLLPAVTELLVKLNQVDWGKIFNAESVTYAGKMALGIVGITTALYVIPKAVALASTALRGMSSILSFLFTTPIGHAVLFGSTIFGVVTLVTSYFTEGASTWKTILGDTFLWLATILDSVELGINRVRLAFVNMEISNLRKELKKDGIFGYSDKELGQIATKLQEVLKVKEQLEGNHSSIKQSIESTLNMDGADYFNDMSELLKEKLLGLGSNLASNVAEGLVSVGDAISGAFPSFIDKLPKKLKEELEKFDRGDIDKLLEEIMRIVAGGGLGGKNTFKVGDLPLQEQIDRALAQSMALGKSGVDLLRTEIQVYEKAIAELFDQEVVDTAKVDEYAGKIEELNTQLENTQAVDEFTQKLKGMFTGLDISNISQSAGDKMRSLFEGALQSKLADSLATTLAVEVNDKISQVIGGLNLKDGISQGELTEAQKEFDTWIQSKIPSWNKDMKDSSEGLSQLTSITRELGEAFESDLLVGISSFANFLGKLPALLNQAGGGGAGGLIGGLSSIVNNPMFQSALGYAGIATAVYSVYDGIMSKVEAKDDARNQREMEKYQEQVELIKEQNQLLESVNDNVRGIYNDLIQNLANNPTVGNLQEGSTVFNQLYEAIQKGYNIGNFSYVEEYKKKSAWKTRRKYKTKTMGDEELYHFLGLPFEGRIEELGLLELKTLSSILGQIDNKDIEKIIKGEGSNLMEGLVKSALSSTATYMATPLVENALISAGLSAGVGNLSAMALGGPIASSVGFLINIAMNGFTDTMEGIGDMIGSLFGDFGKSVWGWSSWNFRRIKDNNASQLKAQIDAYIKVLEGLLEMQSKLFREATLEAFEGINIADKNQLTKQYEDFYKELGLDPNKFKKDIEEMVEANKVTVTAMEDVRKGFLEIFTQGGASAGESFFRSFSSYWDKMKNNIAQVFYDTEFSDITTMADKYFMKFSDGLVKVKQTGGDLQKFVNDFVKGQASKDFMSALVDMNSMEDTFDETLKLFEDMLMNSGLSEVELIPILNPQVIQDLQGSLSTAMQSAIDEQSFDVFNRSLGEGIYNSVKDSLIKSFVESSMYENLIEKFFDLSSVEQSIDRATSFEEAFSIIHEKMKDVERELQGNGYDFRSDDGSGGTSSSGGDTSGGSGSFGHTDYGSGKIEKNYYITIKENTVYGDGDSVRELALKLRKELDDIDEVER